MWESVNIEKAAPGPLNATLNPGDARNRKPKAELLQGIFWQAIGILTLHVKICIISQLWRALLTVNRVWLTIRWVYLQAFENKYNMTLKFLTGVFK